MIKNIKRNPHSFIREILMQELSFDSDLEAFVKADSNACCLRY